MGNVLSTVLVATIIWSVNTVLRGIGRRGLLGGGSEGRRIARLTFFMALYGNYSTRAGRYSGEYSSADANAYSLTALAAGAGLIVTRWRQSRNHPEKPRPPEKGGADVARTPKSSRQPKRNLALSWLSFVVGLLIAAFGAGMMSTHVDVRATALGVAGIALALGAALKGRITLAPSRSPSNRQLMPKSATAATVGRKTRRSEDSFRAPSPNVDSGEQTVNSARNMASGSIRPSSGTELQARTGRGLGRLRIENGTDTDATVKLVPTDLPVATTAHVYVRAHEYASVTGIPQRTYLIRFSKGQAWDPLSVRFARDREAFEFSRPLTFVERSERQFGWFSAQHSTRYSQWQITLHPVGGGTARTRPIASHTFDR